MFSIKYVPASRKASLFFHFNLGRSGAFIQTSIHIKFKLMFDMSIFHYVNSAQN